VSSINASPGVIKQDTLDYIIGLNFMLPREGRLNLQAFQRIFYDHDSSIIWDEFETGVSLLASAKVLPKLEPQIFIVQSLNTNDRMLRLRATWHAVKNASIAFGVDTFTGPQFGLFGRFADRDRVYGELRYSF
jgi:hypothetical protein